MPNNAPTFPNPWPQNTSFSAITPGLQLAWDSTSLGALKTCSRYYFYLNVLGYASRLESPHLIFGIEFHSALELYDREKALGRDHNTCVLAAVRQALIHTWNFKLKRPWASDEPTKTRETLIRSIVWYLDQFSEDPLETAILDSGKPAVELSFRLESGLKSHNDEEFLLCGHLDRVAYFQGKPWIADRKTTKGSIGTEYFAKYTPDNQMSLYDFAGTIIYPEPMAGLIIDAAQVQVQSTRFQRGIVTRTPAQREEWFADTAMWLELAGGFARRGHWPMNDKSCLSGNTIVSVMRGKNKGKKLTIEELYKLFHKKPGARINRYRPEIPNRKREKFSKLDVDTHLLVDKDGYAAYNPVVNVIKKNVQKVYEIKTADGHSVKATEDHEFKTLFGWKRVDELAEGEAIYFWGNRKGLPEDQKKKAKNRIVVGGLYFYPLDKGYWPKSKSTGMRNRRLGANQRLSRLVAEAKLNNMEIDAFVRTLRTDPYKSITMQYLAGDIEVHHIDGDERNDIEDNLETLTLIQHKEKHGNMKDVNKLAWTTVHSVTYAGEEMVYDISMLAPYNNFIANDLVAHNCNMFSSYNGDNDTWRGGCPFRGICGISPEVREPHLRAMYNKRIWDPLVTREI